MRLKGQAGVTSCGAQIATPRLVDFILRAVGSQKAVSSQIRWILVLKRSSMKEVRPGGGHGVGCHLFETQRPAKDTWW